MSDWANGIAEDVWLCSTMETSLKGCIEERRFLENVWKSAKL